MVKLLAIILFTSISFFSNGEIYQKLSLTSSTEKMLQGEWNCISIVNERGERAASDFGMVDNYLKFNFVNKKVFISLAPFDTGAKFSRKIEGNAIEISLEYKVRINFLIDTLTQETLTLRSLTDQEGFLVYSFKRTNPSEETKSNQKEYKLGVIFFNDPAYRIIDYYPQYFRAHHLKIHYLISNSSENYVTRVIFDNPKHESFASYLLSKLDFTQLSTVDTLNNELIVDMEISKRGISRIKMVNPVTYELGNHFFDVLNKGEKFWRLINFTGSTYTLRMNILILKQSEKDKHILLSPTR